MPTDKRPPLLASQGFTLIEMVISLIVLSLVAMVMVPLVQLPIAGYLDAQRRAELQAQLDLIQNKLNDDLASALPGSLRVRQVAGVSYLEYLEVRAEGRYRTGTGGPGFCPATCGADAFTAACAAESCFTTLGALSPSSAVPVAAQDYVVIMPSTGAQINPYNTGNNWPTTRLTSFSPVSNGTGFRFANHLFPADDPQKRFYLVSQAVSYVCNPTAGTITKRSGYALQAAQPAAFAAGIASSTLATRVSACQFNLSTSPSAPQNLRQTLSVQLSLSISSNGSVAEQAQSQMQFVVRAP